MRTTGGQGLLPRSPILQELHVVVSGVDARNGDGTWTPMHRGPPIDVELLSLEETHLLDGVEVETGAYDRLRLEVERAWGRDELGEVPVTAPSGHIDLDLSLRVESDAQTHLVLEFDVDRSLVRTSRGWRLQPALDARPG